MPLQSMPGRGRICSSTTSRCGRTVPAVKSTVSVPPATDMRAIEGDELTPAVVGKRAGATPGAKPAALLHR